MLIARWAGKGEVLRSLSRTLRGVLLVELVLLIVLALTGLLYEFHARRREAELYRPPGKLVDIGGYRLHINCVGAGGPTVILEYGLEATYLDWYLVQPEVARFAQVCTYDRAGYGWSDRSPRPRVPSVMADELYSLLQKAGLRPPFILVAHSFGSYNAVMFAHKFPQEVAGLVLVDGLHTLSDFPFRLGDRISLRAMQAMIPFGLPRWRGWCGGSAPEEQRGEKRAITCRSSVYGAFYRESASLPESVKEMRSITSLGAIPLIDIARDPSIGPSGGGDDWNLIQKQKLSLSTNSELVVATGSGHDVPQARPDLIVAAIKKLVGQASGTGGQPGNSRRYSLPM